MANNPTVKVSNYLVPAVGGTTSVRIKYAGDGTVDLPIGIKWKDYDLDGQPFSPSGFFAVNYSDTNSFIVFIPEVGLSFEIGPGEFIARQYPAPFDHVAEITGTGDGDIVFVNFPVIPFGNMGGGGSGGGAVTIADGADVALGATTDLPANTPLDAASLISVTKSLLMLAQGLDSDFESLPLDFNSLPTTFTYSGGLLQTEVKTLGITTYTRTYTYTGSDLTGISAWVKS